MQKQRKTNLAIEELQIKINSNDQNDKYQIGQLLVDILAYPTVEEADIHRNANRLGNFDLLSEQDRLTQLLNSKNINELILCPCCGNIQNQSTISYCSRLDNIKLGIGVRLYFLNLIYYLSIFGLGFCLYSVYSMITNITASKEQIYNEAKICMNNGECSTANIGIGSKLNSNRSFQNELAIQSVLGLIYVLLWGIVMAHKYFNEINLEVDLKTQWLSASEFTLMIKNIPKQYIDFPQDELLTKIKTLFIQYEKALRSQVSFEVVKINVGYPLFKQYIKHQNIKRQNQEAMKTKRDVFIEWLLQRQHKDTFDVDQQKRNQCYQDFYDFATNVYFKSDIDNVQLEDFNIIFVTLRYSKAREYIQKLNKKHWKLWYFCTKQQDLQNKFPIANVQISKAPEPDEIKWQNIGFPTSIKIFRKVLIFSLALLLIGMSLVITIFLTRYQVDNKQYIISILISLVITVINYIIELIMIYLSLFENQILKSKEQASIGLKIAVLQILNCILVPILLTYITQYSIYTSGGLVTNVFFISLINMVLPLGRFIDPFNIVLKIIEKYYSHPSKRLHELKGQLQLNKLYTYYEFQLGFQYTYIIKTAFFTSFFLTLQPIIAIFASVGLTLMFFTNKYRILYRFKKPNFHSSQVNTILSFILKISLISFAVGQLYFINFQSYSIQFNLITNWVSLGFAVILVVFPLNMFRRFIKQNRVVSMDYNQKLLYLTTDYDRMNPMTKQKAIEQFREYLEQYEKKCNIPLPEKSLLIKKSMIQQQKHNPLASYMNLRQKTKTKIQINHKDYLGSQLFSGDRLR